MPRRIALSVAVLTLAACTATVAEPTVTSATTTPPATTTASTTTQSPGPPPEVDIIRIDDTSFDGGVLNAVVRAGPGLVAVGSDELPEDAAVWLSADGRVWERVESPAFRGTADANGLEGAQEMADVAAGPAGIVAVGWFENRAERDLDAGVWLSQDGREWERIEHESLAGTGPQMMFGITTWNGRYVATGEGPGPVGSGERRPAVWISDDGREWQLLASPVFRIDGGISAVVSRGTRLYAVGAGGHVARPAVWYSDDGIAWDVIGVGGAFESIVGEIDLGDVEDDEDLFMSSVSVTPDGLVAGGQIGEQSRAVFWTSPDGLFWSRSPEVTDDDRPTLPVRVSSVVTGSGVILAVGSGRLDTTRFPPLSFAEVWVSTDGGSTWPQVPRENSSTVIDGPDAPWHIGTMNDVIVFDGGFLVVGHVPYQQVTLPGPFYRQAVWIGSWK